MRKALLLAGLVSSVFQIDAVTLDKYMDHCYKFGPKTNLINGYVLHNSRILKHERFFGNIKYDWREGIRNNREACSFLDRGLDPMANVLIQLFPSAGVTLNAQGRGSFSDKTSKLGRLSLIDVIAGAFKIDAYVRENVLENDIFKIENFEKNDRKKLGYRAKRRFLKDYFGLETRDLGKYDDLFVLGRNIAHAIQLEREEGKEDQQKAEKPYPPFYTNYLINAYAWSVLGNDQLDEFARKLGYTEKWAPYKDDFTERVHKDVTKNPSVVPFYARDEITKHDFARYKQTQFVDCVETALRQFCASVFCKAIVDKNGAYTGEIVLDLNKIPKEATALREFFAPGGVPRDIRELANDGSSETRNAWAKVVSDLPFVKYNKTDCEIFGEWSNFVKAFCYLMKGYTKDNGSEEAAKCIENINNAAKAGTLSFTKETLLNALNTLLKIRTDVEMIATEGNDSWKKLTDKESCVFGEVSIYPNLDSEDMIENNRLNFVTTEEGHGHLKNILGKIDTLSFNVTNDITKPWIERFHDNKKLAVKGQNTGNRLNDSDYPFLDFYMRIGGEFGKGSIDKNVLVEMFLSSTPHIDAIARFYCDENTLRYIMYKGRNASLERKKMLFRSAFMFLKGMKYVAPAISCLKSYISEELSKLFLEEDEGGVEKLSVDITDKTSIEKLFALRVITKRYKDIDPFIEKFIEKNYGANVFDVDRNQALEVLHAFQKDIQEAYWVLKEDARFGRSMFNVYIKCIDGILRSPVKEYLFRSDYVKDFLSLMDCDENNPILNEFIEILTSRCTWYTREEIISEIRGQ